MNDYSLESFISSCDDMIIAEESLRKPKYMTLYHGTIGKYDCIEPTSINMGARFEKIRKSSFWVNNIRAAAMWGISYLTAKIKMNYAMDYDTNTIYIPIYDCEVNRVETTSKDHLINVLNKVPVYVYEINVEEKYVGIGQCPINEYTIDVPVAPINRIEFKYNDLMNYIKFVSEEEFNIIDSKLSSIKKSKVSLIEKFAYKNPSKMINSRIDFYKKLNDDIVKFQISNSK